MNIFCAICDRDYFEIDPAFSLLRKCKHIFCEEHADFQIGDKCPKCREKIPKGGIGILFERIFKVTLQDPVKRLDTIVDNILKAMDCKRYMLYPDTLLRLHLENVHPNIQELKRDLEDYSDFIQHEYSDSGDPGHDELSLTARIKYFIKCVAVGLHRALESITQHTGYHPPEYYHPPDYQRLVEKFRKDVKENLELKNVAKIGRLIP